MFISDIENLKDVIQDSNLNFLIGSGASVPFFSTLGSIETWLKTSCLFGLIRITTL